MGNRLYVGNLSYESTDESLREMFGRCGEVTDAHIVTDRTTGQPRGFGFVTMGTAQEAQAAIGTLDGTSLDGRQLKVNEAQERTPRAGGFGGGGGGGGGRERRHRS